MKRLFPVVLLLCAHAAICQDDSLEYSTSFVKYVNKATSETIEYSEGIEVNEGTLKPYRINGQFLLLLEKENLFTGLYRNDFMFLYIKLDDQDVVFIPAKNINSLNNYHSQSKEIRYEMTKEYMKRIVNSNALSIKFTANKTKNYTDFDNTATNDELLKLKEFGIGTGLIAE